jgi:hypothetical protein
MAVVSLGGWLRDKYDGLFGDNDPSSQQATSIRFLGIPIVKIRIIIAFLQVRVSLRRSWM